MKEVSAPLPRIEPLVLARASRVIRVVGHPLRLRLLELLEGGEQNVSGLVVAAGLSQAVVSQQLRILRAEGVVSDRRDGPRVFYHITEPKVRKILDCIRECDLPELAQEAEARQAPGLRMVRGARGHRDALPVRTGAPS